MTDQDNNIATPEIAPENPIRLTQAQRIQKMIQDAQGELGVVAVGVSEHLNPELFPSLKQCDNDALAVSEAFRDIWQLHADPKRIKVLISKNHSASRGGIINSLRTLAENATENERILFYFSGHGLKIGSGNDAHYYLVPQDAYTDDSPDALIDIKEVEKILGNSRARQKFLILDACYSGGLGSGKKLSAAKISTAELIRYMNNTHGVAGITSSTADQPSWAKSPDPRYSLFTHFLIRALRGEEENALDETKLLTLDSLYDFLSTNVRRMAASYQSAQMPARISDGVGIPVLGDFGDRIAATVGSGIWTSLVDGLAFNDSSSVRVSSILTEMKNWGAHDEGRIEWMVKKNLATHLLPMLGKKVASIIARFDFNTSDVVAEPQGIVIPDGSYTVSYEGDNKRNGRLIHSLRVHGLWLEKTGDIPDLLHCLNLSPDNITLEMKTPLNPTSWATGLNLQQWDVYSLLPDELQATKDGIDIKVCKWTLSFKGLDACVFLSSEPDTSSQLTIRALGLLGIKSQTGELK